MLVELCLSMGERQPRRRVQSLVEKTGWKECQRQLDMRGLSRHNDARRQENRRAGGTAWGEDGGDRGTVADARRTGGVVVERWSWGYNTKLKTETPVTDFGATFLFDIISIRHDKISEEPHSRRKKS